MKRYKMLGPFIFVVGLLLSPLSTLADPDCSEHGTVVDGKCVCTTPRPGSESLGYVGDLCTTPVYYHAASATETDVSASCGGQPCTTLEPQHAVCFLVELGSFFKSPAHLGLMLVGNGGAVLDLQGLMTSDSQDKVYPNSASHYNFVVSSTAAKPTASLYLDRQTIGDGTNNSVFLCTTNMGSTNASFSLRVAAISCPFHFLPDGSSTALCSSSGPSDVRHSDSTCVSGMCTCVAQWSRPKAPVFEGLGFEDCSASCALLPEGPKVELHVDAQAPGTWSFFNFTISASDLEDRHVMASLTATADTTSDVELYLKYWQAPGRHVSQYDLRSGPGDFKARAVSADLSASIQLDSSSAIYRPGVWFLGVFVNGDQAVSYDLRLMRSSCLHDCSGSRGTCSKDTGSCNCSKAEYGEADCSSTCDKVELGSTYVSDPRAGFLFDYLEVVLNDTLASAPGKSLSLVVEAAFSSTSLPAWVTLRPMLLLSGSAISDLSTALMRVVLETAGNKSSVVVEASQVPTGTLYIAIYNPISYPYDIGYSLTVNTAAHCINGCSEHGTCAADGKCSCQDGFTGPDCSVDVSKLQKQACPEGSLREALGIAGGKAYSVCVCSAPDECSYTEVTSQADMIKAFVACSSGYEVTATAPGAIKLSDGRAVNGGGYCKGIRRGTSGGMVFFYCILSIALFCGCVVGGKFGLERYQVWRANQIGGYTDIGGGENNNSLWDAFTGARQNPQHNDSW